MQPDRLNSPGDRGMQGNGHETIGPCNRLTANHFLPGSDKGYCRLADVLREGEGDARRIRQPTNRLAGSTLVRVGMNPARETFAPEQRNKIRRNEEGSRRPLVLRRGQRTICLKPPTSFHDRSSIHDDGMAQLYFAARAIHFSMPGSFMFHGVPGCRQPEVHFSAALTMSGNFAPCGFTTMASFWSL